MTDLVYRCEPCNGSHIRGWAGCVLAPDATPAVAAQLARVGLGADEGHRETLGTREGLSALVGPRQYGKNSELIAVITAKLARLAALAEALDGEASFARDDDEGDTAAALGYAADAIRRAIGGVS